MEILKRARLIRKNILLSSESLEDDKASLTPEIFYRLNENCGPVKVGTRINWKRNN